MRKMDDLRISIAQINSGVGDIEGNCSKITDCIRSAKEAGADVVVFHEMAITGYPTKDLLLSDEFIASAQAAADRIREESRGIAVIVGSIERSGDGLYNTAFVFNDGVEIYTYHKRHLPNYDVFDEKRYFKQGNDTGVFELLGRKMGISICEDIWVPGGPADSQAEAGADILINISASPFHYSKSGIRRNMLSGSASRNGVPIVYVNQVGGQDDLVFDGESYAYNSKGEMIARAKPFNEDLLTFALGDNPINEESLSTEEEVYEALKLGLRDFVQKNGFSKVVLGLSGGIDSALVAALAADALSPENVMCVLMPSRYSSDHSINDAKELCENFGIPYKVIAIEPAFRAFSDMLATAFEGTGQDTTEENIQARIRMINLYAMANKFGYMVLNTSNKSEAAIGYGTLYGDMAGDLSVIGDVPKTMVYALCRHVNELAGYGKIPENILTKEPSAELRENQKDSDSLPDYSTLDKIVHEYVEEVRSPEEIAKEEVDKTLLKDVVRKIDRAENKRYRSSPQIKITPRAFGTGRRMPIANGYRHRVA